MLEAMTMTSDVVPTEDEIGARTVFEDVPVSMTFTDPSYGRAVDASNINRITRDWDPRAVGAVLLSLRPDGRYAVIDGQHRIEAAKKFGVSTIPARVYLDLSHSEEARLYRLFGMHKAQTPLDRFRAAIQERQPKALKIKGIIEGMGLEISSGFVADGKIMAIAAVGSIFDRYGPEMLDLTLRTLYAAFGRQYQAYSRQMITGLAAFIVRYEATCDWVRLVDRLQEEGTTEINQRYLASKRAYSNSGEGETSMGRVFHDVYNKRARNKLAAWEDRLPPLSQRPKMIDPAIRLSQRKALTNVPKIWTGESHA